MDDWSDGSCTRDESRVAAAAAIAAVVPAADMAAAAAAVAAAAAAVGVRVLPGIGGVMLGVLTREWCGLVSSCPMTLGE